MKGEPMAQLNEGLVTFKDELSADALALAFSLSLPYRTLFSRFSLLP
jgi:uncharacterized protein YegL